MLPESWLKETKESISLIDITQREKMLNELEKDNFYQSAIKGLESNVTPFKSALSDW